MLPSVLVVGEKNKYSLNTKRIQIIKICSCWGDNVLSNLELLIFSRVRLYLVQTRWVGVSPTAFYIYIIKKKHAFLSVRPSVRQQFTFSDIFQKVLSFPKK